MSQENKKPIKFCVYCGAEVAKDKIYCPNCGKLVVKLKESEKQAKQHISQKPSPMKKDEISRKCPGCGSVITSIILDQCPICNTALEKIPEAKKVAIQKKPEIS
jgi:endogenous inhibitor of DNA gyrase (YacG/DUF329 family)